MACEMETVLPSFVLVMAMPILGWPLVRVIEVDGASVCSTVATAPSVMGVGLTVGVCVVVGSGEALRRGNGTFNNRQGVDAEGLDLGLDARGQARLRLVEMLGQRLTGLVDVGAEVILDDNNGDPLVRVGCHLLNTGDSLDTLLQRIGDIMLDDGG